MLLSIVHDCERYIMKLLKLLTTFSNGRPPGVITTRCISDNDQRQWYAGLSTAKEDELIDAFQREAFQIVHKNEVRHDANVLRGDWCSEPKPLDHPTYRVKPGMRCKGTPTKIQV